MWPYMMMPPANQNVVVQKTIKEQIQELEDFQEFMDKRKKKDEAPKKEKKWYEKQVSLWDTAILIALFCFFAALPLSIWMLEQMKHLKQLIVNF